MDHLDDVVASLTAANIITDDATPTDRFWGAWQRRIDRLRGDHDKLEAHLAAILNVETVSLSASPPIVATVGADPVAEWPSMAAATADIAAIPLLAAWYEPWREYDDLTRLELVARLRAVLPACPACHSSLEPAGPAAGITCQGCGARLLRPVDEQDRF